MKNSWSELSTQRTMSPPLWRPASAWRSPWWKRGLETSEPPTPGMFFVYSSKGETATGRGPGCSAITDLLPFPLLGRSHTLFVCLFVRQRCCGTLRRSRVGFTKNWRRHFRGGLRGLREGMWNGGTPGRPMQALQGTKPSVERLSEGAWRKVVSGRCRTFRLQMMSSTITKWWGCLRCHEIIPLFLSHHILDTFIFICMTLKAFRKTPNTPINLIAPLLSRGCHNIQETLFFFSFCCVHFYSFVFTVYISIFLVYFHEQFNVFFNCSQKHNSCCFTYTFSPYNMVDLLISRVNMVGMFI